MSFVEAVRSFDLVAAGATLLLAMLGLAMLFSTTSASQLFSALFLRQLASLGLAAVAYFSVSLIPYHKFKRYAPLLYSVGLILLLSVSQLGRVIRGTISRLEIMGIQLQPSEFMKVALVFLLAWLFSQEKISPRVAVILSGFLVSLAAGLIILEPDFGMTALIVLFWIALIVFLGTSWRTISALGALVAGASFVVWHWLLADYQKARLSTFLNPASDPLGAGYNIMQSIVALGSGSWFGRGLGHGPQSQLQFLPEQHTDFILASLGEELGFIGVILVVVLYIILLWRVMRVARVTRDRFGQYLAVGVYLLLLISFFISAGMNMGLLPVTGIPLPLISYGGSSLVSTIILLGVVQSIHIHNKWVRQPPAELTHLTWNG
jgi:rod shape determining protein RodA